MKYTIYDENGIELFTTTNPAVVESVNDAINNAKLDAILLKLNEIDTNTELLSSVNDRLGVTTAMNNNLAEINNETNNLALSLTKQTSIETKLTSIDNKTPALATPKDVILNSVKQNTNTASMPVSSVAAGAWKTGTYIDLLGYREVTGAIKNDATTGVTMNLEWSNDGINMLFLENKDSTAGFSGTSITAPVRARYARLAAKNNDTVAHNIYGSIFMLT